MSLTKEAIQHLEETELLRCVNNELDSVNTKAPVLAVAGGVSILDLEKYMEHRTSYRFNFSTKSIPDFGEYCKEFDKEGAKCFVNSDFMRAESIFDLGTEEAPLHQLHNAKLQLDKTAAFTALLQINGDHISQKSSSDFVEDWADNIEVFTSAGDKISTAMAAQRFRDITIDEVKERGSSVGDFHESMSEMEKIEARNASQIPACIKFKCVPWHGLSERELDVRVSIITSGGKPALCLRIIKLEAHQEDMAEEFKEILTEMFKDSKLKTFIGES
ncbi:hypothetical protein KKJFFJLC_00034 [Vibrio phage vB_VpaS_PGB]|nr:hypothetical protein KKJFFJLC_00034 [Vibrio phage vB_VpaS_PGB]